MKQLFFYFIMLFFLYKNSYSQHTVNNDMEINNYIKIAESYIIKQDYKNAIINYTAAITIAPNISHIYEKRSMAYFAEKNYEKAVLDNDKIIELEKNSKKLSSAYFYRGLCKIILQHWDDGECEDLNTAKKLGFEAEWENFSMFCPTISN
ncbi:hypothetical protein [Flavobacterium sp.]|uniref:tetratricopeptide repeat protein n=1 Tax=Flavobacterium sp. TaxID=239 RepID=UPI00262BF56E|nr:hypothetical protein [Flavobacterium sp.]MDD3004245.1 hypothetical protein [Flavobacterium sp.]